MTKENYYACSTKKELLIVDNADHALSSVENKDEYDSWRYFVPGKSSNDELSEFFSLRDENEKELLKKLL